MRLLRGGFVAIDMLAFNAWCDVCQVFDVIFFDFLFSPACLLGLVVFWVVGRVLGDLFLFQDQILDQPANRSRFNHTRDFLANPYRYRGKPKNQKQTPSDAFKRVISFKRILFGLRSTRVHARIFFFNFIKIKLSDYKEDNFILFSTL